MKSKKILKYSTLVVALALIVFLVWARSFYVNDPRESIQKQALEDKNNNIVRDVTGLYPIKVQGIIVPHTTEEIAEAVKSHKKVSIGGGRYSMGGQTASADAVQIDMREFNKVLNISTSTQEITVQAGARWRDIQDAIDPYGLSVSVMQTYSNFTVGGSLSVNVHGRYIGQGPIISSVKKIQIVLADGKIVEASPDIHRDIFYSAIGGLGGIGVITEATLVLAPNDNVERSRVKMSIEEYKKYFFENVRSNPDVLFHNGDIYPMDFDSVSAVNWTKTSKQTTTSEKLIPRFQDYAFERIAWVIMSEWPFGKWIREYIFEPIIYFKEAVHTRNYEASYDVAELEPQDRSKSTYVLQEYFVPVERFDEFYPKMRDIFVGNDANILNVSIRHAKADPGAILAWARSEVFAFVVYYKQETDDASKDKVARWTREMIDAVISVDGAYYLPYQPHATDDQFHRAYPKAVEYFEIKNKYDPSNKFTNNLWNTYYSPGKLEKYKEISEAKNSVRLPSDYVRNLDNIYITVPEWYIVYSAGEYANVLRDSTPSSFDYIGAIKDYWSEYSKTQKLAIGSKHQNSDYGLVLKVIGVSFTFENSFKWAYENSIGRLSEWIANDKHVEEDDLAAKMARDYEDFIYYHPWYDFPYYKYYSELYSLPINTKHSFGEWTRKFERQMFLSFEITVKRIYSGIIRYTTHQKFGISDDKIMALIKDNGEYKGITTDHYQAFTLMLKKVLDESLSENKSLKIIEIAGNDKITLCYFDEVGASIPSLSKEVLRDKEVVSIKDGKASFKDRITVEISVEDIVDVHKSLKKKGIEIEHFYDY